MSVSHITGVTLRSEKEVNMFMAESLAGYKVCYPGDLIINTMWAWMGALGVAQRHGIVSPSYHVYRLRERRRSRYAPEYFDHLYRTRAYISEITSYSKGIWSSRLRLYPDAFYEIATLTPPIEEQRAIVDSIKMATQRIDVLRDKARIGIERLAEHRTALISAAVTGKIDVRKEHG